MNDAGMDDIRIGALVRALRVRAGMRQVDLARAAGISQSLVSSIECGHIDASTIATLRRVFQALGGRFDGHVLWRGADLDRLLDSRHAALVEASVRSLGHLGWETHVETTYSIYGERGSIDVLGAMAARRAVVVEEIKSDLPRIEETIRKLDEKERLVAEQIAMKRFGWRPTAIGRILVLPDTDRARRLVAAHADVLDAAFPARGAEVRDWLREPEGRLSGILFVADTSMRGTNGRTVGIHRLRVRRPRPIGGRPVATSTRNGVRVSHPREGDPAARKDRSR
jgi:transcriptional regulator with XRE-family HTH domain